MAVVALVVHPERQECKGAARELSAWLRDKGHSVVVPKLKSDGDGYYAGDLAVEGIDLAVSLGGDGTMLRTVELAAARGSPVLGINLGNLGYLTEVEASGMEQALERFFAGDHSVEERMTLEVRLESGERPGSGLAHGGESGAAPGSTPEAARAKPEAARAKSWLALNEAVVQRTVPGHTIRLASSIAGRPFVTYAADGLMVATPTGSTAYNLSVHGPIVSPRLSALILAPVAPHMLFDRALVLEPSQWVGIEVLGTRPCELVVDGVQVASVVPGDRLLLRPGARPARFVTFGGDHDFHSILKAKFGLTDR